MEINKQYENIGKDFITKQEDYFSKKIDQARVFIKNMLPDLKGKCVLDAGCGHGKDILIYESLGAKEVYGLDSSEVMIQEAKKIVKNPNNLVIASMENLPFEDNQFDIIVGRYSLHYIKNLDKTYSEFNRILKKNGILIFTVHHPTLGFMQLDAKNYNTQEVIKMKLYNSVNIQFPNHTLKNYFSDKFFQYFTLDYLDEEKEKDAEYPNKWGIPGFMGFRAIKRSNLFVSR